MAPLRALPFREVRRKLQAAGFVETTQKGSHVKYVRSFPDGTRTAVVPRHREVAVGTLRSILRQAGISDDDFDRL